MGIASLDGTLEYRFGDPGRTFFIASATKLYVTALMARLREAGKVDWDAPFVRYVGARDVSGLHVWRGVDRTPSITVRQLMAHTSGLPDYFEGRRSDGATTFDRIVATDFGWDVDDVIRWSRDAQRPHFLPGAPGRALYSDTNYQLLGAVIEAQFESSFASAVEREICTPLGLTHTWCLDRQRVGQYDAIAPMRLGRSVLRAPLAMASVGADGGVVSTVDDGLRFLRAFFGGQLFNVSLLAELQADWRRIFFPLEYGTGVMRFVVPWYFSPFKRFAPLVGHSGASGAVLFCCPQWRLFAAGTVNQVAARSSSYQLLLRALAIAHG